MPTIPQKLAGCLTEPPVSVPSDKATILAATAAAEPPEEPPGTTFLFIGFLVGPKYDVSVESPRANSSIFVLPIIIPSLFMIFSTTVALNGEIYLSSIFEPQVVFKSLLAILSFIPIGRPLSRPIPSPFFIFSSIFSDFLKASSLFRLIKALISESSSSIFLIWAWITSLQLVISTVSPLLFYDFQYFKITIFLFLCVLKCLLSTYHLVCFIVF